MLEFFSEIDYIVYTQLPEVTYERFQIKTGTP